MSLIIENKYKILKKLGEGSFGKVFIGENTNTKKEVAIKIDKEQGAGGIQLRNEARIYRDLGDMKGIPAMRSFGTQGDYSYLVIDLLGKTLEETCKTQGNKLSLKVVILIGLQMIKRVEDLHIRGIIHRDIKPANFIFGKQESKSLLHIVDFGLAKFYKNSDEEHIPMETGRNLTGTLEYASLNVLQGKTPSRRDDLEAICYILIFLLEGKLPWADNTNHRERDIPLHEPLISNYLSNLPGEFITFIRYCRNLKFNEEPNYLYLAGLLKNLQQIA